MTMSFRVLWKCKDSLWSLPDPAHTGLGAPSTLTAGMIHWALDICCPEILVTASSGYILSRLKDPWVRTMAFTSQIPFPFLLKPRSLRGPSTTTYCIPLGRFREKIKVPNSAIDERTSLTSLGLDLGSSILCFKYSFTAAIESDTNITEHNVILVRYMKHS